MEKKNSVAALVVFLIAIILVNVIRLPITIEDSLIPFTDEITESTTEEESTQPSEESSADTEHEEETQTSSYEATTEAITEPTTEEQTNPEIIEEITTEEETTEEETTVEEYPDSSLGLIDVTKNKIAICKIDGITDDYPAISKIMDYVNNTSMQMTIVLPYTGSAMVLSDSIIINRSNVTLQVMCDIDYRKPYDGKPFTSVITATKMKKWDTREPMDNIHVIGNGSTINVNGNRLGVVQTSHDSGEYNGIWFRRVRNGSIKNINVVNGLTDGIKVYNSQNILVENCTVSGTVIDNGITVMGLPIFTDNWVFNPNDSSCCNNVIVRNCTAYNNEDLGFSASACRNVTFENCYSTRNGNVNGFNSGGGYSAEKLMSSYFGVDTGYDMNIKFIGCKAYDNNNYAFYSDVDGVTLDNCEINRTYSTGTSSLLRQGHGIYTNGGGKITILNTRIENTAGHVIRPNFSSQREVTLQGCTIKNCTKGIYGGTLKSLTINSVTLENIGSLTMYLLDGDSKEKIEISNLTVNNCGKLDIGNASVIKIDGIHTITKDGTKTAVELSKVTAGSVNNIIVEKGKNTANLTAFRAATTVSGGVSLSGIRSNADVHLDNKGKMSVSSPIDVK